MAIIEENQSVDWKWKKAQMNMGARKMREYLNSEIPKAEKDEEEIARKFFIEFEVNKHFNFDELDKQARQATYEELSEFNSVKV